MSINLLSVLLPSILVCIFGLINVLITITLTPRINSKFSKNAWRSEKLYLVITEFLDYLTEIASYEDLIGVPNTIRKYSLKIHILFDNGTAPQLVSKYLEDIFHLIKSRRQEGACLNEEDKEQLRILITNLRKELSSVI